MRGLAQADYERRPALGKTPFLPKIASDGQSKSAKRAFTDKEPRLRGRLIGPGTTQSAGSFFKFGWAPKKRPLAHGRGASGCEMSPLAGDLL